MAYYDSETNCPLHTLIKLSNYLVLVGSNSPKEHKKKMPSNLCAKPIFCPSL